MNRDQLIKLLHGHEWSDAEFKEAQHDVPKSAYETVSAFSNTHGGWLVFGVRETGAGYEVSGVAQVDRIQNDFLSALRADNKVNHDIRVETALIEIEGKLVLVFRIPEASRQHKPIYLNGDIRRSFIRRGGCDHRCTMLEIERFLRDSAEERWDGQVCDFPVKKAFDRNSLKWYRARFREANPGHDDTRSDQDFLYQWGYLLRQHGVLKPTRAAIMLFGSPAAIHQMLPRPTLDAQWIPSLMADPLPEVRWLDRAVYEENLIASWLGLVAKYYKYESRPFRGIDPHTLMRDDAPPGYRVFREAAINLLIHQDYADHTRKAVIKFYRDVIQLWNPGDVFGSDEHLLEPGEKEVRNPRIVAAFRRLALCEQAGTGMQMMTAQWQTLGHPAPQYVNDRSRKAFEFQLALELPARGDAIETGARPESKPDSEPESQPESLDFRIVDILTKGDRGKAEISEALGQKEVSGPLNQAIRRMLKEGIIERTIPDKPQSRLQKYRKTEKGRQWFLEHSVGSKS